MTLREMREAAGLTQEAAAARAGVRQGVISQVELGKIANPALTTLEAFARAYDKSLEEIAAAVRESVEAAA
jgi:transcriptional regulator with XRE-family HTH domain